MKREWGIIEVLKHSRHDWLNKLQLIKGNLDLNRIERAKEVIHEIVMEAQQETKLTNLNTPQFSAMLLRSNWEKHLFQLEFEVLCESGALDINDSKLASWTASFFSCLDGAIEPFQENHLSISVDEHDDGARFFFDFSGIILRKELIESFLTNPESQALEIVVEELSEQELALEIFMPSPNILV